MVKAAKAWLLRWALHPGQAFNRLSYCSFWECKPADDGTWWYSRGGSIVLLEPKPCAKCGTIMGEE